MAQHDWIGEKGTDITPSRRKYIHDHRKKADLYGPKLPFEIGVFKKKFGNKTRDIEFVCECGKRMYGTKNTYIIACPDCGGLCKKDESSIH